MVSWFLSRYVLCSLTVKLVSQKVMEIIWKIPAWVFREPTQAEVTETVWREADLHTHNLPPVCRPGSEAHAVPREPLLSDLGGLWVCSSTCSVLMITWELTARTNEEITLKPHFARTTYWNCMPSLFFCCFYHKNIEWLQYDLKFVLALGFRGGKYNYVKNETILNTF